MHYFYDLFNKNESTMKYHSNIYLYLINSIKKVIYEKRKGPASTKGPNAPRIAIDPPPNDKHIEKSPSRK